MIDVIFDRLLDKSASTVANAMWRCRTGLYAIKVGGMLRFSPHDVKALLERGRETFDCAQSRKVMRCDERTSHEPSEHLPSTDY